MHLADKVDIKLHDMSLKNDDTSATLGFANPNPAIKLRTATPVTKLSQSANAKNSRNKRDKQNYQNQIAKINEGNNFTPKMIRVFVKMDPDDNKKALWKEVLLLTPTNSVVYNPNRIRGNRNGMYNYTFTGGIVWYKRNYFAVEEGRFELVQKITASSVHGLHKQINATGKKESGATQLTGFINFTINGSKQAPEALLLWNNCATPECALRYDSQINYYTHKRNSRPVTAHSSLAILLDDPTTKKSKLWGKYRDKCPIIKSKESYDKVVPPNLEDIEEVLRGNFNKLNLKNEDTLHVFSTSVIFESLAGRGGCRINSLDEAFGIKDERYGKQQDQYLNIIKDSSICNPSKETWQEKIGEYMSVINPSKETLPRHHPSTTAKKKVVDRVGKCKEAGCEYDVHAMFYKDGKCYKHGDEKKKFCVNYKKHGCTRTRNHKGGFCKVCYKKRKKAEQGVLYNFCKACNVIPVENFTLCSGCKGKSSCHM